MRITTLGIALSTLVGTMALAQTGTTNGTSNTTAPNKPTNGQATTPTDGTSNGKKSTATNPTTAAESPAKTASNTTSTSAKIPGRTISQTISENENLDTLQSLVAQAGLNASLSGNGSFTVFAPTDAAFELLGQETLANLGKPESKANLTAILTYHVVPGTWTAAQFGKNGSANTLNGQRLGFAGTNGSFTVGEVAITQTDIKCSNGVIHVVDAVLLPTQANIVEVAGSNGNYSTFLKACKAAGLEATLTKNGNFTVFAPTDEAFAKLPAGMLEMLMQPENRLQLREILSYHVVPGNRVFANDLNGGELSTVLGETITVATNGGTVTLANGTVVNSDVQASNGVIHGVDSVLLPGANTMNATVKAKGKPVNATTATGQEKNGN